jgi:HK97 gp10 family phage protein
MARSFVLSTRNTRGVIANMFAADRRVQAAVKRSVRDAGFSEYQIAYGLCPVDTGFMQDNLTLEFHPSELSYELGWKEEDFTAAGLGFYPIFVEFGTSKMAAQPSLFPARDAVRPEFRTKLRQNIRTAIRRRGAA